MSTAAFSSVRAWKEQFDASGWWHSFELPGGARIEGVCTVAGLSKRLDQYPIPEDLHGARVLDIGAWDGWYSFEMERRGADVVAVDCWDNPRFHQIHAALHSHVDYRQMDVYDLTPATVGRFDIVLFMGVLYHLKHPLLALERVCSITRDLAIVDSFVLREELLPGPDAEARPIMEFFENDEFGGQTDNWWAPNVPCLMAMCRTAGFARVEHRATLSNGACIACYRKWLSAPIIDRDAPVLLDAMHHTNFGVNFSSSKDDYVAIVFRAPDADLDRDVIEPQVGDYGVRPISLSRLTPDTWQANLRLPPGLAPGWHDTTVRLPGQPSSNAIKVAVDIDPGHSTPVIVGIGDGSTWESGIFRPENGSVLCLWVSGLPENADRANVRFLLDGRRLEVFYVERESGKASRQINVRVLPGVPSGSFPVQVVAGASSSAPTSICIRREKSCPR